MDPAAVVMLLCMVIQGNGASFKEIAKSELPTGTAAAVAAWASSKNIPIDESGTSGAFYQITLAGSLGSAYVADFSGDDPDPFRATAVMQDSKVIGESLQVES